MNMKNIIALLILSLTLPLYAQQNVITASLTVTNSAGTAFPETITINGQVRTFTNNFNYPASQVYNGATPTLGASNLFQSLAIAPLVGASAHWNGNSNMSFMSFPGQNLNIVLSAGWGTLSLSTNTLVAATVVRVPPSVAGLIEHTNVANGLVQWLDDPSVTNAVSPTAPAFSSFINASGLLVVSNLVLTVGANDSNYVRLNMQISTNYANSILTGFSNLFYNALGTAAFTSINNYQPANAVLTNLTTLWSGGIPPTFSYLIPSSIAGGISDIALIATNYNQDANSGPNYDSHGGNSVTRLDAFYESSFDARYQDGAAFLTASTSYEVELLDNEGTLRYQQDDPVSGDGYTYMRGGANVAGIVETPDGLINNPFPVTFNTLTWPAVTSGTTTNFLGGTQNSGTGGTTVDAYVVPGNVITNAGDTLVRTIGVTFAAHSATKQVQVYFAGTKIIDTGAIANTGSGSVSLRCEVTVVNNTTLTSETIAYNCMGVATGTGNTPIASVGKISGVDVTGATSGQPNFYIVLTAGSGGSTGDIVVYSDNTRLCPSSLWQGVK